jgi:hypothetical protein
METFIVRVWVTGEPAVHVSDRRPRGVVRHVRTGRETSFASWEELRGALAEPAAASSSDPALAARGEGEAS